MKKLKTYKVCHLTSVHSINDIRIFTKECSSLAKNKFEVTLIACSDRFFEDFKNGVKRISLGIPVKNRVQRIIKRTRAVYKKALEIDADLYHLHDPELLIFALRLKRRGKKVIFDSHEFYGLQIREKEFLPKVLRNAIASLYLKYEAYVCRKIDAVVQVCTINGVDYFDQRSKQTIFVTNAPDISVFLPNNGIPFTKRSSIIYLGGLTHSRGITNLVEASAYTSVQITLAGPIEEPYKTDLELLPEFKSIAYLGILDKQEVINCLNQSLAGIATLLNIGQYNKIDALPTKVYEYMAMGIPVILSNTPFNKQMNELYKFGICVDSANPKEIAEAINYLKNNITEAEEMGKRGKEAIEKFINWNYESQKLIKLYNLILS